MAQAVVVPNLGLAITEVTLTEWLKEEGDPLAKGDVIANATTDKVTMEITAPEAGVLLKKLYQAKEVVPVNKPVAVIGQPGEDISSLLQEQSSQSRETRGEEAAEVQPEPASEKMAGADADGQGKMRISPLARRLAKEHGVDLADIKGSGPGGAIKKEDILAYVAQQKKTRETPVSEATPEKELKELEEIIPFIGVRKTIAEHMVKSKQTAAHVTTVAEVDMTDLLALRRKIGQLEGRSLSVVAFTVKAALFGIKDFPVINSTLQGDRIIVKKYVNMGIAAAGKDGLVVPVIHRAERKSLLEIAYEIEQITREAREGTLSLERLQGGTFSISNAGSFGAVMATPIINQPQSAVLWTGRITKKPVVYQDEIAIRSMMYLVLSYDHRVLDGATAAQYLQQVRKALENPLLTLLY
jgi:pyruvate dehydrogenase E2 component (dihydrolipoamide acetyltransferase)